MVAIARSPYSIWHESTATEGAAVIRPRDDRRIESVPVSENRASWYALRGVEIDSGSVHTLTDLASDSRVIFVVNHAGRILTVRKIAAPLGFVDGDLTAKRICAVRTLEVRELVCYNWRWTSGRDLAGESPQAVSVRNYHVIVGQAVVGC